MLRLAKKLVSGKATASNKALARTRANKLHAPKSPSRTTRLMTETVLSLGVRKLRIYQAILLVLASYDMPSDGIVPVLKGGTVSTQYSQRPINVSNIDIQMMSVHKMMNAKSALHALSANNRYWRLYFKENMVHVLGLAVAMVMTLNRLKGLKKAVQGLWGEPIDRVAFKIRGSHVAKPRKITLISIDLHIKTVSGKKESVPVFDMVLGDARNPKPILSTDLLVLKKSGKTLYQYKWDWVSKDFETMVKNKDPKAVLKRDKRMSRWLEGLLRTPQQKQLNKTKAFRKIDGFSKVPIPRRGIGEVRRLISKYADSVKSDLMLRRLVPS